MTQQGLCPAKTQMKDTLTGKKHPYGQLESLLKTVQKCLTGVCQVCLKEQHHLLLNLLCFLKPDLLL